MFDADGRYLGEVEAPAELALKRPLPFIRDHAVIAKVEDDIGTVMVKRYRLVPPGAS